MITDEERARALIDRWSKLFSDELADQGTVDELSIQFASVRLQERDKIATWLRSRAFDWRGDANSGIGADTLEAVARWIENREHSS